MQAAELGDVIYCDPPYVPLSNTANFTQYHKDRFGVEQQLKLAKQAELLAEKGIPVLISNHATDFTLQVYAKAQCNIISVPRLISCKGQSRNPVEEILALYVVHV
jgi:DNA adenine methylase